MKEKLIYRLKIFLADTIGNLLVFLRPEKAKKMAEHRISLIHRNKKNMTIAERLMRASLVKKLDKIQDHETIADHNREFWANNTATELFQQLQDGFEKDFIPNCSFIFDILEKKLSEKDYNFKTIVEIGTGNGDVLHWLSSKFSNIERFVGLDLSKGQIELNKERFTNNEKLEFIAGDAYDWVKDHAEGHTIFFTSKGVLEYFLEKRLQQFLFNIHKLNNIIFIAIEPNAAIHDFETTPHSIIYGNEPSFSHNYPVLFKSAGFKIWHLSQKRWLPGSDNRTFIGAKNFD